MAPTRHPRSRTGCWVCRLRKKKCDETRPTCQQCRNLKIECGGYDGPPPLWMKDPEAAKKKKEEIKLQIGKRGRRRRKNRARMQEFGSGNDESRQQLNDSAVETLQDSRDDPFGFETIDGGILVLKPFNETGKPNPQTVKMLDSPHPPLECFRCPVKNSFARSAHPPSSYGLVEGRTGKPLLQNIRSGVLLVTTPPLWKPSKSIGTRTKEEEIFNDEYDIIMELFMSSSKIQATGASETSGSAISPTNLSETNLIKNYIRNVFRSIFCGMLESRIHETLRSVITPLLRTCPGFVKGCMSNSAMHLAISSGRSGPNMKDLALDACKYSTECIQELNKRLVDEGPSELSLALMLSLTSPVIPSKLSNWKPHLQASIECLVQMDLLNRPSHTPITQFMVSRVIWLDILSALTLGRAPQLWANYREILGRPLHERSYCGLLEMTGCDDTVLFLVSEVMCVEEYKFRSFEDGSLSWNRGRTRAMVLDTRLRDRDLPVTVQLPPSPEPPSPESSPPGLSPLQQSRASFQSHDHCDSEDDTNSYLLSPSPSWSPSNPMSPVSNNGSPYHSFATSPDSSIETSTRTPPPGSSSKSVIIREESIFECPNYPGEDQIPPEVVPDQGIIIKAITATFRTATRIHLWSIGIGFFPRLKFFKQLLQELIVVIALVPTSLSRTIMWPLLVGGCIAIDQHDRNYFISRCDGILSGIAKVIQEVWRRSDESDLNHGIGRGQEVHWRTVMRDMDMELLLV